MFKIIAFLLLVTVTLVHSKPWVIAYSPPVVASGPVYIDQGLGSIGIDAGPIAYTSTNIATPIVTRTIVAPSVTRTSTVITAPLSYVSSFGSPVVYASSPYANYYVKK